MKEAIVVLRQKGSAAVNASGLVIRRVVLREGDILRVAAGIRAAKAVVRVLWCHGSIIE
jgi:hypothetical protein